MFNGVEISNTQVEGDTLAIVITFGEMKSVLQILTITEDEGDCLTEIHDEKVFDDDEEEIFEHLQYKLLELSMSDEDVFKYINKVKIQSNSLFDIKKLVDTFNFCIYDKYSNILEKRILNIGFLTQEDKKTLQNKGYYFW